ncbi:unnamed protein product [Dovyalis caffra]|uniref:Uncharacterized protein n=1 Tax=Dovyalis caffra TaxID=77055 RepID=A0AAV1QR21_9ROSI|nr:unnamed protein product [Dovyalis caffra]
MFFILHFSDGESDPLSSFGLPILRAPDSDPLSVFLRFDFVSGVIMRVSVDFAQTQGPLNFAVEDNVYRAIRGEPGGIKYITNYSSGQAKAKGFIDVLFLDATELAKV